MSIGRRLGTIGGALLLLAPGQVVLYMAVSTTRSLLNGALEVLQEDGQMDARERNGERQLQYSYYYKNDHYYSGSSFNGFPFGLLAVGAWLILGLVAGPTAWLYWKLYIYPSYDRFLGPGMIMPAELMGRYKYDVFDFSGALGMCCCFTWCTWCAIGDLWYRAGYAHSVSGNASSPCGPGCLGWQFFVGCCGCCFVNQALDCFAPCALAALSSGLGWMNQEGGGQSGMGSIITFHQRFGIPADCNSFCGECCLWCWCLPCQATREWQQINDALKQWPLPAPSAPPTMVVGQPVVIQATATAVDPNQVWKPEVPSNQVPAPV